MAGNFLEVLKNGQTLSNKSEISWMGGSTAFAAPAVLVNGLTIAGK